MNLTSKYPFPLPNPKARGRWRLRGFLELRRPWGFSPEARRGSQGASRAAPGKSGLHASKGKARAELRPARRQARLPHSRSLLLPGRVCATALGRRAGAPPLWLLARSFPVTGPQPLSSLRHAGNWASRPGHRRKAKEKRKDINI